MSENRGRKLINMTGRVYGTLTVGERARHETDTQHIYWWCHCSACGVTKRIAGNNLREGRIQSCACQKYGPTTREKMRESALKRWARYRGEIA